MIDLYDRIFLFTTHGFSKVKEGYDDCVVYNIDFFENDLDKDKIIFDKCYDEIVNKNNKIALVFDHNDHKNNIDGRLKFMYLLWAISMSIPDNYYYTDIIIKNISDEFKYEYIGFLSDKTNYFDYYSKILFR